MRLVKSSLIYLCSTIINNAIPFLLLPVLTRYLTPAEYGTLAIFQLMIYFLDPFINMNLQTNITKNFFTFPKEALAKYISNIYVILFIKFIISISLLRIAVALFGNIMEIPQGWLLVIPFIVTLDAINGFNLTILRN